MLFGALAVLLNLHVRHAQLQTWVAIHGAEGTSLFSTADAPYFLYHAGLLKKGFDTNSYDSIRSYPNLAKEEIGATNESSSLRARPLLSVAIEHMASSADPIQLIESGNKVVLLSAALTAVMIIICFGAAGYWVEGSVAAIGGGLSLAYLTRSSIGRIDTDQLNLGFMYLIFGLVVFAGRADSRFTCLIWCGIAGITAHLFMWWYGKPELVVMATITLVWMLLCMQKSLVTMLTGSALFLALADITLFNPFGSNYLQHAISFEKFLFPNTFHTITEIKQLSLHAIITNISSSVWLGLIGLVGLAMFAIRHPVMAVAFSLLVAFGLLNFVIGNRAIFYSAPMLWFGVAFLINTLAGFIATRLACTDATTRRNQIAITVGSCIAMIIAWGNSPTNYVPQPSFPKPVLDGLVSLKDLADPDNSVVATWWDYGYASMFLNELPTLHDGGSQTTPTTHFLARGLLGSSSSQSVGIFKFLSSKGHEGIAAQKNIQELEAAFQAATNSLSPDLYLVVTQQMAGWMGSISKIANWDIEQGQPTPLTGNLEGAKTHYRPINCRFNAYPQHLTCAGQHIDLERGLIDGAPLLVGWTHAKDGAILRRRSFANDANQAFQIIQDNGRITAYLLHRQLYDSTFNKLYYLGEIDHPALSMHYDDYPHIRIYRIEGRPVTKSGPS